MDSHHLRSRQLRNGEARPRERASHGWPPVFVVVGAAGLLITAEIASSPGDSTGAALLWAALASAGFLLLLTVGAYAAVATARSRRRHVFSARRCAVCGWGLAAVGGVLTASLIRRGPLEHAFASFEIGPGDVAGVGLLIADAACLVAAGVAFFEAWDARRAERSWSEWMPTP